MIELEDLLRIMIEHGATDLHLTTGTPPQIRVNGRLLPLDLPPLTPADTRRLCYSVLTDVQKKRFEEDHELDFSFGIKGLSRFRANLFVQRGSVAGAFRAIPYRIRDFHELGLPPIVEELVRRPKGLILVTGPTGAGKSTTLAAMIDRINEERYGHIITIEDPIEFLHKDNLSMINQREIGTDTSSFAQALKMALRQDPDVILVGEMRDFETIDTALLAAETGHLVLSTLHTLDATETINRIVAVYPPYQQKQVRLQLANVLRGVISQRLLPRADGLGRVPAVEVMINTARIKECIMDKDRTPEIPIAIAEGHVTYGSQTFDQSLMSLYKRGLITLEEALRHCSNPDDFVLRVKGILATSDMGWQEFEVSAKEELEVEEEE